MAKLQHRCPACGKVAQLVSESKLFGGLTLRSYKCGHSETVSGTIHEPETLDIESLDGKKLFKFQLEGAAFAERANMRCLIADEMGLGKTVQALAVAKAHDETRPFIIFAKAGLRVQWMKEAVRWCDFMVQVIDDTNSQFLPGMDGYIISMDSAWRIGCKNVKVRQPDGSTKNELTPIPGKTLADQVAKLKIKLCIIDECQLIKNPESKRTKAIVNICGQVKYVIALSGTPIKNNAAEYFTVLNILRPDKFPNKNQFVYGWCDSYFDGYTTRTGGIKDPRAFLKFTEDFIIRRDRKTVLPDLPLIFRNFQFCELGSMVEDMYIQTVKEFNQYYDESGEGSGVGGFERAQNILAYLSKMRHLAGLAKVDPICEHVEAHITSTDRKIMVFIHHKDVGQLLKVKLEKMAREWPAEWGKGILEITSDMDAYARDEAVQKFKSSEYRVMIGSTLASGEGLNLQFCQDCILGERQWNPANEEQAEARFPRPGSTADKINATYFVAVGTVDEFFSELVERKREIVNKTMAGEAVKWDESGLVRELSDILRLSGGKKWGF
jgi:SWI/SNF-related matrix-associated actin-dependent regulator of chromatin subfamily A-like protein 1